MKFSFVKGLHEINFIDAFEKISIVGTYILQCWKFFNFIFGAEHGAYILKENLIIFFLELILELLIPTFALNYLSIRGVLVMVRAVIRLDRVFN